MKLHLYLPMSLNSFFAVKRGNEQAAPALRQHGMDADAQPKPWTRAFVDKYFYRRGGTMGFLAIICCARALKFRFVRTNTLGGSGGSAAVQDDSRIVGATLHLYFQKQELPSFRKCPQRMTGARRPVFFLPYVPRSAYNRL